MLKRRIREGADPDPLALLAAEVTADAIKRFRAADQAEDKAHERCVTVDEADLAGTDRAEAWAELATQRACSARKHLIASIQAHRPDLTRPTDFHPEMALRTPFAVVHSQSLWLAYWPTYGSSASDEMELVEVPLKSVVDIDPALGHPMPGN